MATEVLRRKSAQRTARSAIPTVRSRLATPISGRDGTPCCPELKNQRNLSAKCGTYILAIAAFTAAFTPARAAESGEHGVFIAVGYGGRRISSPDGVHWDNDQRWSDLAADNDDVLFNVAFGHGRFIAVGGGAKIGHLLSTWEGRDWNELPSVKGRVATIVFGNGRFIAGHDAELLVSMDGDKFEPGEKLAWKGSVHARRSAFGDGEGGPRCVIIGDVDLWAEKKRVQWRASTEDGRKYASQTLDSPAARDVAYGAGIFIIAGPNGLIESSHDGEAWQRHETAPDENFSRVVWTGRRFLVSGGRSIWSSPDGLAWSKEARPSPCSFAWARDGWRGIGFSWGGNLFTSTDLVSWQKVEIPPGPSLEALAYGSVEPSAPGSGEASKTAPKNR